MTTVKALIVGGGPSGLALAYGLQGNTLVVEKESSVGGLCRSFCHDGGVFDIGGHSFHTPYPEVFELVNKLMDGRLHIQERDARIATHGTTIPYPFQKFFNRIPDSQVVEECERGLRNVNDKMISPENFEDFILQKFGKGIADHFMLPYNRKLWARDIKQMSVEWTSERIAAPKGDVERFDVTGGERKPLQSGTQVGYPIGGGFDEIFKSFVPHLPAVELNSTVVHINPKEHVATTDGGEKYHWEFLASTMPLPVLVDMVEGTPDEIVAAADKLEYMSLRVELLLAGRKLDTPIQRLYVSDSETPSHKIALNHNSSDFLRAKPCHAIMAEVSMSLDKPVEVDQIAPKTISLLCNLGILDSPDDIVWRSHVDVEYAYPVYTHERPALVKIIKEWMVQNHIHTLGRFGDWEYINSDKCIMKGLDMADELRHHYFNG